MTAIYNATYQLRLSLDSSENSSNIRWSTRAYPLNTIFFTPSLITKSQRLEEGRRWDNVTFSKSYKQKEQELVEKGKKSVKKQIDKMSMCVSHK